MIIGYQVGKLMEYLNLSCEYKVRDVSVSDEIGVNTSHNLAKLFFDMEIDPYFRSTITEARLYMALYKNF
jgi:hypothetical protein